MTNSNKIESDEEKIALLHIFVMNGLNWGTFRVCIVIVWVRARLKEIVVVVVSVVVVVIVIVIVVVDWHVDNLSRKLSEDNFRRKLSSESKLFVSWWCNSSVHCVICYWMFIVFFKIHWLIVFDSISLFLDKMSSLLCYVKSFHRCSSGCLYVVG